MLKFVNVSINTYRKLVKLFIKHISRRWWWHPKFQFLKVQKNALFFFLHIATNWQQVSISFQQTVSSNSETYALISKKKKKNRKPVTPAFFFFLTFNYRFGPAIDISFFFFANNNRTKCDFCINQLLNVA